MLKILKMGNAVGNNSNFIPVEKPLKYCQYY